MDWNVTLRIARFSAQSEGSDVRICEVLNRGPGHRNWNFCKTDECFIELIRRERNSFGSTWHASSCGSLLEAGNHYEAQWKENVACWTCLWGASEESSACADTWKIGECFRIWLAQILIPYMRSYASRLTVRWGQASREFLHNALP